MKTANEGEILLDPVDTFGFDSFDGSPFFVISIILVNFILFGRFVTATCLNEPRYSCSSSVSVIVRISFLTSASLALDFLF